MPSPDPFRETEAEKKDESPESKKGGGSTEKKKPNATWDRSNYSIGDDKDLVSDLNTRAESGQKRGVSDIPTNANGNKFPIGIIPPSIDNSLGDWKQTTPTQFLPYPNIDAKSGFTKPPIYPSDIFNLNFDETKLRNGATQPVLDKIAERKKYYNLYKDDAGKQFTHLLDYFAAQKGLGSLRPIPTGTYDNGETKVVNTSDIYLGSSMFIKTPDDNEDPTILGFDLKIKTDDSPLFNGSIEKFIAQFGELGNSEIAARGPILVRFKEQLNKFLKNDLPVSKNSPTFNGGSGVKTYYLKKIGGLDRLVDSSDGNEIKQFIDYGKDFITLDFYEDVTQNIGYLASLYKALSYSRIHGKQPIPENLLRFDLDIEITEIRKYNRVFKGLAENKLDFYVDKISKYVYTLYECQFFFPSLPHGGDLAMADISPSGFVADYQIKMNYKFSTMKFTKFTFDTIETGGSASVTQRIISEYNINNKKKDPSEVGPNETLNNGILDGEINSRPATENASTAGGVDPSGGAVDAGESKGGDLDAAKKAQESSGPENKPGTPEWKEKQVDKSIAENNAKKQTITNETDTTNTEVEPVKGTTGTLKSVIERSAVLEARENRLKGVVEREILTPLENLGRNLKKAAVSELSSQILSQAGLLNKTLGNLNNTLLGGVSPPTNVYTSIQNPLFNSAAGNLRNFVGQSVRGFFTKLF